MSTLISDHGTNFIGTKNLLENVDLQKLKTDFIFQKIKWKNIPVGSPWYERWWERLIRVVKDLLKRTLGTSLLKYEELNTVLCDFEAVVNSRPLTYISDEGDDLIPLTPAHFMQSNVDSCVADLDAIDENHFNNHLRYLQKLRRDLRVRIEREYLANLVYDPKSKNREINVKVGDIVLLKTDGVKKIRWPLGKVIETIPGKDGKVRVLKIKTSSGTVLRPCQRVCPLEVNHSEPLTFSASAFPAVQIA